jgi:hypothetical protein
MRVKVAKIDFHPPAILSLLCVSFILRWKKVKKAKRELEIDVGNVLYFFFSFLTAATSLSCIVSSAFVQSV